MSWVGALAICLIVTEIELRVRRVGFPKLPWIQVTNWMYYLIFYWCAKIP